MINSWYGFDCGCCYGSFYVCCYVCYAALILAAAGNLSSDTFHNR